MDNDHYIKMRKSLLTNMILVPLIPFVLVLGIGYYYFTASLENSTIASMNRIVEDHRQMIESFLSERQSDLEFMLNSYTFEELNRPEKLLDVFKDLQKKSNAFVDLGIFNEDGVHVAYHGPYKLTGKLYKEAEWFIEVMKKGYYISDVFLGFRRVPHFVIAVAGADSGKKWVLRATIDTYLFNDLVKKVRIGKTGEAYILNSDGIFQTERRSGGTLMNKDPDRIKVAGLHGGINTFIKKDTRGDKYLYATSWMKDKKWLLVVRQEIADAFKSLRSAVYLTLFIVTIGGGVIVALSFYLTDRIVKRMKRTDTEKGQLQQQLIGASRLAELGEMAAGFAHEINNPLQIIKSEQALIEMTLSELKEKGELKESEETAELDDSMNQIQLQIGRCAKITQAILKFGRQSEPVPQDVDLGSYIPEVVDMVKKKANVHGMIISQNIAEDIPNIHGDPAQLQQVLLNLLNNAIDAIVERHGSHGGEVAVEADLKPNGKVGISVTDNGSGISTENQKKIFSPFFTTKPVGKGTGLGLSVCYGIIDGMGGVMEVSSERNVGTTFTISLPAVS